MRELTINELDVEPTERETILRLHSGAPVRYPAGAHHWQDVGPQYYSRT